jgi:hypothetical protein
MGLRSSQKRRPKPTYLTNITNYFCQENCVVENSVEKVIYDYDYDTAC